jgi:aldose 1-epimerase
MSTIIAMKSGDLAVRVSRVGGAIVDATFAGTPFLRPYAGDPDADFRIGAAASFPLVPFGNRVAGNSFSFREREYALAPNTDWDPLHLHGDGWLADWTLAARDPDRIELVLVHAPGDGTPYAYEARQVVGLADGALSLTLSVRNTGPDPMPFGIGHHPFLPLTLRTVFQARARTYWTERAGFLPDTERSRPDELDFDQPRPLPRHWVNNGFEGWDGRATVTWPERGLALAIEADAVFDRYFIFVSDMAFEPAYAGDYFCFEPMSHSADGHHHADLGGLRVLSPGEVLAGSVRFHPYPLSQGSGASP